MVLSDIGVIEFEDTLAAALKTATNAEKYPGANIYEISNALKRINLEDVSVINRSLINDKNVKFSTLEKALKNGERKAIVSLNSQELGRHAVVVDKIENGRVFIRDPLPLNTGAYYSVSIEDFERVFFKKFVAIKIN